MGKYHLNINFKILLSMDYVYTKITRHGGLGDLLDHLAYQ